MTIEKGTAAVQNADRVRTLVQGLGRTPRPADAESRADRLAEAGRVLAMGGDLPKLAMLAEAAETFVGEDLEAHLGALEAGAFHLVEAASALEGVSGSPPTSDEPPAALASALERRTQLELCWIGADALTALPEAAKERRSELVEEADALLDGQLHRLVAFNRWRGERARELDPAYRGAFPWLCRGVGIDPAAVAHLPAVAELVAAFPAALDELAQLAGTWRVLHTPPAPPTVSIAEWCARRSPSGVRVLSDRVGLDQAEVGDWLLQTERVRIALSAEDAFVVRTMSELVAPPSLRAGTTQAPVAAVPSDRGPGVFTLRLPEGVDPGASLTVALPFADGIEHIEL
jgi:hypothetical protein